MKRTVSLICLVALMSVITLATYAVNRSPSASTEGQICHKTKYMEYWSDVNWIPLALHPSPEDLMATQGWGDAEIRKPGDGYKYTEINVSDGDAYDTGIVCIRYPDKSRVCFSVMGIGEAAP